MKYIHGVQIQRGLKKSAIIAISMAFVAVASITIFGAAEARGNKPEDVPRKAEKVTVCHLNDEGGYNKISVSVNAQVSHEAHGDAQPGQAIPGLTGTIFSDSCEVAILPSVPEIISPANGATLASAELIKIDWTDSTGTNTPIKYQYQSYKNSGYTQLAYTSDWLENSEIPTSSTPEGDYYLRVRAMDSMGYTSEWSNGSSNPYLVTVKNGPSVNMGYISGVPKEGEARWRNFRTNNSGWDVAVGAAAGTIGQFSQNDFGDMWNFAPNSNKVTFTYDPTLGTLSTETVVKNNITYNSTYSTGNLGNVNYMQWQVNGDPGKILEFNNVELTTNGETFNLGNYQTVYNDWYIVYDLSNGFSITGDLVINGQATNQEGMKLNISIGEYTP